MREFTHSVEYALSSNINNSYYATSTINAFLAKN